MATQNPYSDSLLMDAFRGSLSNAESLGRGFAVAPIGLLGDINALARQYITPRLPQSVQGLLQAAPAAPTTEQILSNIPRASAPRIETSGMEQLGAAMNFKGPVDVARGAGRIASGAVRQPAKAAFKYPQEEAMILAQQRAALPKEQFGLGLPPNNTAQQRAEAMFPIDVYHGSISPDILKFDTSLSGSKSGNPFDDYVFSTTSPENASGYALNWGSYKKEVESLPEFKALNEQISDSARKIADAFEQKDFAKADELEQIIKQANAKKMDFYNDFMSGKYVSEGATVYPLVARSSEFMPYEAGGKNWMRVNRPAIEASQEAGFSGVNIKNVKDNAGKGLDVVADTYATNRPEDLFRSRNAAFDPFRRTTAIAALMGVAAPDLLAQEQQPYQGLLGR